MKQSSAQKPKERNRELLKNYHSITKSDSYYKILLSQIQTHNIIAKAAFDLNTSPCLLLRYFLTKHIEKTSSNQPGQIPSMVTKIIQESYNDSISFYDNNENPKKKLNDNSIIGTSIMHNSGSFLNQNENKNSSDCKIAATNKVFLPDSYRKNIKNCVIMDHSAFSPKFIQRNMISGLKGEERLLDYLKLKGFAYYTDEELKVYREHKKPDCLLKFPVMIEGRIINWFESKNMFGDLGIFKKHLGEQLISYINRYGDGMVIYWMGFDIDEDTHENIIVKCDVGFDLQTIEI
eukprot:GHVP01042941.1.p1 GENE.GHVP01042941.1~~GHVP01042941.1.p1  ORF type:complete len:291 (+),score=38.95 GHVP01042941.1:268-1140(+)